MARKAFVEIGVIFSRANEGRGSIRVKQETGLIFASEKGYPTDVILPKGETYVNYLEEMSGHGYHLVDRIIWYEIETLGTKGKVKDIVCSLIFERK